MKVVSMPFGGTLRSGPSMNSFITIRGKHLWIRVKGIKETLNTEDIKLANLDAWEVEGSVNIATVKIVKLTIAIQKSKWSL